MKRPPPACPACGSHATLPFESEGRSADGPPLADVWLGSLLLLLALLAVLLFFLLYRASLPAALLLLLALALYWRRRRERARRTGGRPRRYICLDCDRDFRA